VTTVGGATDGAARTVAACNTSAEHVTRNPDHHKGALLMPCLYIHLLISEPYYITKHRDRFSRFFAWVAAQLPRDGRVVEVFDGLFVLFRDGDLVVGVFTRSKVSASRPGSAFAGEGIRIFACSSASCFLAAFPPRAAASVQSCCGGLRGILVGLTPALALSTRYASVKHHLSQTVVSTSQKAAGMIP
jgi:hypothetical protein